MQKWVPVDPLVTNTIAKPARLEPPASDRYNNMSYVIAFGDDASARDVTRRYAKSFNAKTRRNRVEFTKDGELWWEQTMRIFERPFLEDKDQLELGELTAKAARETMPGNLQDFKNHPIYALERQLRRNEIIYPKREIGKVGLSKHSLNKKDQPLESVYRRADVQVVKSADGWYRQGREVKVGEQPMKRVVSRQKGSSLRESSFDDEATSPETPMYAIFQTDLYKPPPIVDGRVSKNAYGNIDVYTAHMVPAGGFHLNHPEAARAGKLLGIDYAEAVTGFQFKGRHGTASVNGIVASLEYREALETVISGFEDERVQAEQNQRTAEALGMWKQFLLKLRISERVKGYTFEGERDEENELREDHVSSLDDFSGGGGGFLPDDSEETIGPHTGSSNRWESTHNLTGVESEALSAEPLSNLAMSEAPTDEVTSAVLPVQSPVQSSRTSRYTLLVVPEERRPAEIPALVHDSWAAQASSSHIPQHTSAASTASDILKPPPPDSETVPLQNTATARDEEVQSSNFADSQTQNKEDTISIQEISTIPELVHGDSASELDQSDMISHDPEDEDAEPEWLMSD